MRKRKNGKRIALIVLCTVLAAVLTAMVGVTVMAHSLMNKMNRVEDENSATISIQEMEQYLEEEKQQETGQGPAIRDEEVEWGQLEGTLLGESDDVINILLIGQDRRPGETRSRSDSMILCTVNRNDKTIVLTSFMRDLYVQIPGYGNNRINASYAWGGMELLNKTLEQNFGIYIDGNVEVDFEQFTEIVDLLGGVPMELRADEAQYINIDTQSSLTEGMQQLTGKQALSYSRIRNLDADADFSRTNRQRKVLDALFRQVKDAGLVRLLTLLDEVLPMVTTDMGNGEILGYATKVFPMMSGASISSQRVPADGAYKGAMIDGMSVLVADMDKTRQMLQDTLGN
jgi:LCP family protein required for cell wall assembly